MNDFDEINALLATLKDNGTVEPIDDSSLNVDFWDWADVVGIVDQFVPVDIL